MDKAKAAVSSFMHKSGHHDTTVHERVAPQVQHETVKEQREEQRQIAVDREVHQDHYHTSVQPVQDREILAEQHHHNIVPVEHRTHDNRDHDTTARRLEQEATQFKDQTVRAPVQHQSTTAPSVAGEHVHHHVHETIQPVVQKETIEPHVVHTTVPIHELHHNEAKHHSASALPAVSMSDFKRNGGSLTGRDERVDHFAGEPRNIEQAFGSGGTGTSGLTGHSSSTTSGPHNSNAMNKVDPRVDSDRDGSRNLGATGSTGQHYDVGASGHHNNDVTSERRTGGSGLGSSGLGSNNNRDTGIGHSSNTGAGALGAGATPGVQTGGTNHGLTSGTGTSTSTQHKPSLMDKLNPMKDANGDGKKGFMK